MGLLHRAAFELRDIELMIEGRHPFIDPSKDNSRSKLHRGRQSADPPQWYVKSAARM